MFGDVLFGRQEHSALAFDWLNLVKHNRGEKRGLQADMCSYKQDEGIGIFKFNHWLPNERNVMLRIRIKRTEGRSSEPLPFSL